MKPYGGLAFHFSEPEHRGKISQRIEAESYFTESVSKGDINPAEAEICLISLDGETLSQMCLARMSKASVTARVTLKFSGFLDLGQIKLADLNQFAELQTFTGRLFLRPVSRLHGFEWEALLGVLKQLRPALSEAIDGFEKKRLLVGKPTEQTAIETIAQERDATRLALEFFGLEKDQIRTSLEFAVPLEPAPFLKGLQAAKLREDPMIDHDAHSLPGFHEIKPFIQGSVEYTKDKERITVLNVNRAGVEKAIGVDLVYYNHSFKSYVMIQYKRLHKRPTDWAFNLNDPQFKADLSRMNVFNETNPRSISGGDPRDYRLDDQVFYFKFCKNVSYEPLDSSMIDGMYLPLDYLQCLLPSRLTEGSYGGRSLGYKNVLRHFNNTEFIALVRNAWIGSRADTTEVITKLVKDSIRADHSVIIGITSPKAE